MYVCNKIFHKGSQENKMDQESLRGKEREGVERREGKEGYEQWWYVQSEECCKALVVVSLYQKMAPRSQLKKKAMGEIKICKRRGEDGNERGGQLVRESVKGTKEG